MAKIIELKTKTDDVLDYLKQIEKAVKEDKLQSLLFVGKCADGVVMIGHTTMNWTNIAELKAHIEVQMIDDMIKENYVTSE